MIINNIQEFYIHLFQINHFVNRYNFLQKTYLFQNIQFQAIGVWFTDQNIQPLEIEDKINLTLVIK